MCLLLTTRVRDETTVWVGNRFETATRWQWLLRGGTGHVRVRSKTFSKDARCRCVSGEWGWDFYSMDQAFHFSLAKLHSTQRPNVRHSVNHWRYLNASFQSLACWFRRKLAARACRRTSIEKQTNCQCIQSNRKIKKPLLLRYLANHCYCIVVNKRRLINQRRIN